MNRLLLPVTFSALVAASAAFAQDPLPARMHPAKTADRAAAISSIQAQLKAFGRDDYKTAVTYQSAGLKGNFPSTEAFRSMMVQTYPEFAHSKAVTFGPAQSDALGTHLVILTTITGQDGVKVRAIYMMVREGKIYRVEGVADSRSRLLENTGPSKDV